MIVVTADAGVRDQALQLGADASVTKPFSPLGLLRTIGSLLGGPQPEA